MLAQIHLQKYYGNKMSYGNITLSPSLRNILGQEVFSHHEQQVWTVWVHLHNFFNKGTVGPLYPQVLHPWIQPTMDRKLFSVRGWESEDVEGWLYAFFYAFLYKELEHLFNTRTWILVFMGGGVSWNQSPGYRGTTVKIFQKSKVIHGLFTVLGSAPQLLCCSWVSCIFF